MDDLSLAGYALEISEFVEIVNQTFDYSYPTVTLRGEVANYKISKNRWVYFDLKDELSSIRFFGSVYNLSSPIADGMILRVFGKPNLHQRFGFSINFISFMPEGEGALRKASELLRLKLQSEGLFNQERKRSIDYPPDSIGLITSTESAAYVDFIKIINDRWVGLKIECLDVQVQGLAATNQIVSAIGYFNKKAQPPDLLVLIRGGGSQSDLYTFDTEQVTRAVSGSRVPILVAIGHEKDISLSELAADKRASTPSHAAELIVPDKNEVLIQLKSKLNFLDKSTFSALKRQELLIKNYELNLDFEFSSVLKNLQQKLVYYEELLNALNPSLILKRGYSIIRSSNKKRIIYRRANVKRGDIVNLELSDGQVDATIN